MRARREGMVWPKRWLCLFGACLMALATLTVWPGQQGRASATAFPETVGGDAHTWTNYTNAGGYEGPLIPAYATVEISCRRTGFRVADGNVWWYQIASSPWSNDYYVSADAFYNNGQTSGSLHGTPFYDPAVPVCGSTPPPTQPPLTSPPPTSPRTDPHVQLSQGPAANPGYWYAVGLQGFSARSGVSVTCADSVDPAGFRTFSITTDGNGDASTSSQCRSADGPDHWVVANGISSNRLAWSAAAPGGVGGGPPGGSGGVEQPPTVPPPASGQSVFYSGDQNAYGSSSTAPAEQNFGLSRWSSSRACRSDSAAPLVDFSKGPVSTLAGWSRGRLGVVYFLEQAGATRVADVHRIVLFDPGDLADMDPKPGDSLGHLIGVVSGGCEPYHKTNELIASWLKQDARNHLLILAGKDTESCCESGQPKYRGIWKYYLADIWNQPFASRALVCRYPGVSHPDVLSKHADYVKNGRVDCPDAAESWHP